ncbi:unnamed protein product [Cuscuta campestris]|uniref:RHOMBOID-like protein n=1 Tax=Cuscuta campestris TaxID=132261 RepID=A0A484MF93_9ASTE|nr:unnamed protein product [Cuscuta campestris]
MMRSRDLETGGTATKGGSNSRAYPQSSHAVEPYYAETSEKHRTSWLVPLIVAVNVVVFAVIMFVNNCPHSHERRRFGRNGECVARFLGRFSFQPLRENPLFGPSSSTLDKMGALEWNKIVSDHQRWRLVTCIWLHAGVVHLLANMLSLFFIGIRLEQQFGFVRVGIIYLLSGISGSVLSSLFIQHSISVGASGAVFGLLGAILAELLTNWTIYSNKVAALFSLVVIIAVNLAVGILPHVDNFAHIGGFVSGFLLGFVLLLRPQFGWLERRHRRAESQIKSKYNVCQYFLLVVALILFIIGFTVGLVMLFRGESANDHCKWCHYLSCIPTSRWRCDEN